VQRRAEAGRWWVTGFGFWLRGERNVDERVEADPSRGVDDDG
jgi:hypothetical protein